MVNQAKKVTVSYSSIQAYNEYSHTWINKMNGLKTKDLPIFQEGTRVERIILDHVSGRKPDERIVAAGIKLPEFEVVQKKEFDPDTKKFVPLNDKYQLFVQLDGISYKNKSFLDVKASSKNTRWGMTKLRESNQFRLYSWAYPDLPEGYVINADRDVDNPDWVKSIRVFKHSFTKEEQEQALAWVWEFIKNIEAGNFDLTPNTDYKKCLYESCPYCS